MNYRGNFPIPSREEIQKWIESEEGRLIFETLFLIDVESHDFESLGEVLNSLYNPNSWARIKSQISWKAGMKWLKKQMPIKNIRNAVYIPEIDKLILSNEAEFLLHREVSSLEQELRRMDAGRDYQYLLMGTTATLKEKEWKIFDLLYCYNFMVHPPSVEASKEGLARKGYILLDRPGRKEGDQIYIPILPE